MKPRRSLREYLRCESCGVLRHMSYFVKNRDGFNPCCGSNKARSLARTNLPDGSTTYRLPFLDWLCYFLRII